MVAVDVGGSGLRLQIRYAGTPSPFVTAPGARIGATGIDVAGLVHDATRLLYDVDGMGPGAGRPDAVVWSMRGLVFLADQGAVVDAVHEGLGARRTAVVSDAVANLVGAVGGLLPGGVVAAGTGAVAFGSDFDSTWRRVDGWGHVLGDVGSGAWLGLSALRSALRAIDGTGPETSLVEHAREQVGDEDSWPRLVMTRPDAPELLAGLAPHVSAAAGDGDAVAVGLCREAGQGLAASLLAAAHGLADPVLCATGGVLASGPVAESLDAALGAAGRRLTPALGGALEGAGLLGDHLAEHGSLPTHPTYLLLA